MIQMDVQITEIGKVDKEQLNKGETERYFLTARDAMGLTQIRLRSAEDFNDYKTGQLVRVTIDQPQTTLEDFEAQKPKKKTKKGKEVDSELF